MRYSGVEFEHELRRLNAQREQQQLINNGLYIDNTIDYDVQNLKIGYNIEYLDKWLYESMGCNNDKTSNNSLPIDEHETESFNQFDNSNNDTNNLEWTDITDLVSIGTISHYEYFNKRTMEEEEHVSLFGIDYHTKKELPDLKEICSSLEEMLVENKHSTIDETQQQSLVTYVQGNISTSKNVDICRTRAVSNFNISLLNGDGDSVFSQTETIMKYISVNGIKSDHSIVSVGIKKKKKKRQDINRRQNCLYDEDPSDDPVFEKRRNKAIKNKKYRENKIKKLQNKQSK